MKYLEESIVIGLITALALVFAGMIYVNRQPVQVKQVTNQCVLIEQAGFKTVKCLPSVTIEDPIVDERE
jgi:hypothetical protein